MIITNTVDNEEANCNRCDNCNDEEICKNYCGSEHGWGRYERSEEVEE